MTLKKETLNAPPIPKTVLTSREAAAFLSISLPTLYRQTKAGFLAHVRIGRAIRYRMEDLEAFLSEKSTTKWVDFVPERRAGRGRPRIYPTASDAKPKPKK